MKVGFLVATVGFFGFLTAWPVTGQWWWVIPAVGSIFAGAGIEAGRKNAD